MMKLKILKKSLNEINSDHICECDCDHSLNDNSMFKKNESLRNGVESLKETISILKNDQREILIKNSWKPNDKRGLGFNNINVVVNVENKFVKGECSKRKDFEPKSKVHDSSIISHYCMKVGHYISQCKI